LGGNGPSVLGQDVGYGNVSAVLHIGFCDGPPNAAARAGDQGSFVQ
jgi:hypothetical protein